MSTDVFEAIDSQGHSLAKSGSDALTLRYIVTGTTDRDAAYVALSNAVLSTQSLRGGTLLADKIDVEPLADDVWAYDIAYAPPETKSNARQPRAVGEVTFDFDGTGGTFRRFEAFEQSKFGGSAPDHGKRINVTPDGVEGVDVVVPQLSFTVKQKFAGQTITMPWLRQLALLTGTMNLTTFLGFQPGEVLFLGPSGQQPFHFTSDGTVQAGDREVTYRFAVSPNLSSFDVGDITVSSKRGHDYLWVQYEEAEDSGGSAMTRNPIGVYVAAVYEAKAWSTLGVNDPDQHYPVAA